MDNNHRSLFYKNLGISTESLEKVELRASDELKISGLSWFFDIRRNDFQFIRSFGGIFNRLYENYHHLKNHTNELKTLVQMKIICIKRDQGKMDVLIDENITMDRMEEIFENEFVKDIVHFEKLVIFILNLFVILEISKVCI